MGKELPISRRRKSSAYASEIAKALRIELGGSNRAIKTLMRWTHASERTAKCWLAGTSGPSGENLLVLIQNSDAVLERVLAVTGRRPKLGREHLESLKVAISNTAVAINALLDGEDSAS
jgi:hypothetical protein